MDPAVVRGIFDGCTFDVCSFESNGTSQDQLCSTLQKFNDECVTLGLSLNKTWSFNWRSKFGCSKLIEPNSISFLVRIIELI